MTAVSQRYPGITNAALEISYDNGGINRHRTERAMLRDLGRFLDAWPQGPEHLTAIDLWLSSLPHNDVETICAGDQDDAKPILAKAPPFTDTLLNEIFEKVG
jgi:hypothetical protein